MSIQVFTDGCCKAKGAGLHPGGWGCCIKINKVVYYNYGGKMKTTNQQMEMQAMIQGLQLVDNKISGTINVYTDSKYILNGLLKDGESSLTISKLSKKIAYTGWLNGWIAKGWKKAGGGDVLNQDLWKGIMKECERCIFTEKCILKFHHVNAHTGKTDELSVGNEFADELANRGYRSLIFK
jgi:ribonuclease HI